MNNGEYFNLSKVLDGQTNILNKRKRDITKDK